MRSSGSSGPRSVASRPTGPWLLAFCGALLSVCPSPASAGGPLALTAKGQPFRWSTTRPLRYWVDAGPLGSRDHAQAIALIEAGFRTWQAASSAAPAVERPSEATRDLTGKNVLSYLNGLGAG